MLNAIVTVRLKSGDREMLSYNPSRGCYILETELAEYEVRDCDYDTLEDFRNGETGQSEIQVFVLCDPADLSFDLSTEVGHDFNHNVVFDEIRVDNIQLSIEDEFIKAGEVEEHENDDLIAGIINYLNEKVS